MFRRKEDSLFDTTDSNQSGDTATMVAPTPTTTTAPSSSASSSVSAPSSSASPAGQLTRPMTTEARPATAPAPTAFRPNAGPIGGNRMPEAKPAAQAAVSTNADKNKNARRVLTVGNDILLKGEIATCDRLVIEGKVDATLNEVHTVEIAETGSFKGAAHIEDAEISGLFEGELIVRNRLIIYATGKVRGKISYGEIEIERGGELTGEIKATNTSTSGTRPSRPTGSKEDKFAA